MQKLGMKPTLGVSRVTVKKSNSTIFEISKPFSLIKIDFRNPFSPIMHSCEDQVDSVPLMKPR
ncbi:hypothetical protein ABFS82_11G020900 [Erythranthe guttata]